MNRSLSTLLAVACFAFAGCAQIESKINQDVQSVVVPDLQAAKTIAQSAPDHDPVAQTCFDGLIVYANNLPTTTATEPLPQISGVFSLAEEARVAVGELSSAANAPLLPPLDKQVEGACLLWLAQNGVEKVKLAAIVAGLAKGKGILDAAGALKAARALQGVR